MQPPSACSVSGAGGWVPSDACGRGPNWATFDTVALILYKINTLSTITLLYHNG